MPPSGAGAVVAHASPTNADGDAGGTGRTASSIPPLYPCDPAATILLMSNATVIVDRDFVIDSVSPRLFGSFVEHLGRGVYGGIYEPGHPTADRNGFRQDVLSLIRELGVTVVRYPGGNFVSNYRWEDGVGPKDKRPCRRELAWVTTETNQMGTDEFIDWCRLAGIEPMLAVNLGTRGPAEAADYYEYCNHPSGTALADLRRSNGHDKPHDVRLWCMGNEADGPWQMGQKPAAAYGSQAREAAKLMYLPDTNRSASNILKPEFIACGSASRSMPTYGKWDQEVLEQCFDKVDYLSVHSYVSPNNQDTASFLAFSDVTMAPLIREITAICDAVAARRKSAKRIHLSYDEWNVWSGNGEKPYPAWAIAPDQLQDVYTLADALCVGTMLITLLNHCDRVKIACLAQLVNVIAPIMTRTGGPAWRQTIFYPFEAASRLGRGVVLRQVCDTPTYKVNDQSVGLLTSAVVQNADGGLTVFAVNRDLEKPLSLTLDMRSFPRMQVVDWTVLDGDLKATNTEDTPDRVQPRPCHSDVAAGHRITMQLPKASWNVIHLHPPLGNQE